MQDGKDDDIEVHTTSIKHLLAALQKASGATDAKSNVVPFRQEKN